MRHPPEAPGLARQLGRSILRGASIGAALAAVLIVISICSRLSRSAVFDNVTIGARDSDALTVLQKAGIDCDGLPSTYRCSFDDFWRIYRITVSGQTHLVVRKEIIYKRHPGF
jgi:hypothetical protein